MWLWLSISGFSRPIERRRCETFSSRLAELEAADTQVLGVSMDNPFANRVFADQNGVTFPLLSDSGGKVIREYGIYKEYDQFRTKIPAAHRAT
jgi:peroxiredoxin